MCNKELIFYISILGISLFKIEIFRNCFGFYQECVPTLATGKENVYETTIYARVPFAPSKVLEKVEYKHTLRERYEQKETRRQ